MFHLRQTRQGDLPRNFEIWKSSVEATHHFLSREDFLQIGDLVKHQYLPAADLLVAADNNDEPHGFMGVSEAHIDTLFVHAHSRGAGIGRMLVGRLLEAHDAITVDVNEQNLSGRGFYHHLGFEVFDRSERDDDGRPYPLLRMRRTRSNTHGMNV
ncbi:MULTISPECIES: acetyltransferase [unclassified Rhizobium]|uniref:acetyltransferase n=1 Tax=unclassified Rhizobium TaxID=2613769 RepID=UPI0006F6BEF7|nr:MULTISPECIES: acetyltransferase [unclassified Rhizobium]KQV37069.1 GNAT family acetyltransferase [Rhizobium sp. Root1212]KRD28651.1 GNAT family acetyltransferase [Rhizobium sp. Root268]